MKKLVLALLAVVLMSGVSFASQVENEIVAETLSTSNPVGEADLNIADSKRVSFFVNLNNNRTTAAVTATITAAISLNGTDWTDISWMDTDGGVTPQTTEDTTLKKQQYVGWLDNRNQAKYIRIRVNSKELGLNWNSMYTSADNATLSVTVVQDK
jgi:hypothetical protein